MSDAKKEYIVVKGQTRVGGQDKKIGEPVFLTDRQGHAMVNKVRLKSDMDKEAGVLSGSEAAKALALSVKLVEDLQAEIADHKEAKSAGQAMIAGLQGRIVALEEAAVTSGNVAADALALSAKQVTDLKAEVAKLKKGK